MAEHPPRFANQVVVVTGAASGIGEAIARQFAAEGARVAVLDVNADRARGVASELHGSLPIECDVSMSGSVQAAIERVTEELGPIDVAVNNAGISGSPAETARRSRAMEAFTSELLETMRAPTIAIDVTVSTSDEEWRRMFAIHVDGTFFVTRSVLPGMLARRSGAIVNVTSICGIMGCVGSPGYSAAKAAIVGFTRAVAKEVANRGIRINAVAPGFIDTAITPVRSTTERSLAIAMAPMGRLGTPGEVADCVLYLSSPQASYFTGAVLSPNGGVLTAS